MTWIKKEVPFIASMDGAEVEFDEDAVKALLPSELTLLSYNLNLCRKSKDKLMAFINATNATGSPHILVKTLEKKHFKVCQSFEISSVWKQALENTARCEK